MISWSTWITHHTSHAANDKIYDKHTTKAETANYYKL